MWLKDELNTTQIYNKLCYETTVNISTIEAIRKILTTCRICIAHYLKDKYEIEILSSKNENKKFAIEQTLITHISNKQVWLIRIINTDTKRISNNACF